ncbi:MAG: 3-deoxy-manno-octulosonate cytidylyltransferase [Desulfamplus sp.]|nr:3-deoxy-manno-octulosonate cytidylyltransferase [Desulfamplus sp.]
MNTVAIIPARMGASRFPGKPMHKISGIPMIGHCFYRVQKTPGIVDTYVATCDQVIADYIDSIGGKVIMTSSSHTRATGRSSEAMEKIEKSTGQKIDLVIMVQGDEPLVQPEDISNIIPHFQSMEVEVVNLMARLTSQEKFVDKNNVKVVVNQNMDALYFSREAIPSLWKGTDVPMYMQVGVIAFRRDVLYRFEQMPETRLEQIESVDMNRILETGGKIRMVMTHAEMIGVDTPEEADYVSQQIVNDPLFKEYSAL